MTGMRRVMTAGFCEYFAGNAFPRDTPETFCFSILAYLLHRVFTQTVYTYTLREVLFKEKILDITLRVRDCHTHNPLHNHLWFFQLLPLHIQILERLPNTYHTHSKCKVKFLCFWEALEEVICLVDAIGLNCMIRKAREDKTSSSQLIAGIWRAQVHGVCQDICDSFVRNICYYFM